MRQPRALAGGLREFSKHGAVVLRSALYLSRVSLENRFANLPDYAESPGIRPLLGRHGDPFLTVVGFEQFEAAATHDALWNATQKEMLARGTIHGYYRMY